MAITEKELETSKRGQGPLIVGGLSLAVGLGALIASLTRPVSAATGTPSEPVNVIVDGDVRQALAALILQGETSNNALAVANEYLKQIVTLLGGTPAEVVKFDLVTFKQENQTLQHGTAFPLYEIDSGAGSLIWTLVDVSDPDTTVIIKVDDLKWEFKYSTLYAEGVDKPLFPGAWLSKYDAGTGHYALIFSAGDVKGFKFERTFSVNVRFDGVGTATLNEGRGVLFEAP